MATNNEQQIIQFLKCLGAKNIEGSLDSWLGCSCPLAPFTHRKGTDTNPSFAVTKKDGKFIYNCFTCGGGTLESLLTTLDFHVSKCPEFKDKYNLKQARKILNDPTLNIITLPDFEQAQTVTEVMEWHSSFLDLYPLASAVPKAKQYLLNRGVSIEISDKYNIRYDMAFKRVCFPIYDIYGRLVGMRGRAIDKEALPQHYDYSYQGINNTKLCFLNEQVITNLQPVVVVEGQFDMLKVASVYPNVIANLTCKITLEKLQKLLKADAVLLMLDNDESGRKSAQKAFDYLYKHNQSVAKVLIGLDGQDPDSVSKVAIYEVLKQYIDKNQLIKP